MAGVLLKSLFGTPADRIGARPVLRSLPGVRARRVIRHLTPSLCHNANKDTAECGVLTCALSLHIRPMVRARQRRLSQHLISRWQVGLLIDVLPAQQLCCLIPRVLGCHLGLRHHVASFTDHVLVDRYVIAFAGSTCHSTRPPAVSLFPTRCDRGNARPP